MCSTSIREGGPGVTWLTWCSNELPEEPSNRHGPSYRGQSSPLCRFSRANKSGAETNWILGCQVTQKSVMA